MATVSSGTSARAVTSYSHDDAHSAAAAPEVSSRSPREAASEMVRMATRISRRAGREAAGRDPSLKPVICAPDKRRGQCDGLRHWYSLIEREAPRLPFAQGNEHGTSASLHDGGLLARGVYVPPQRSETCRCGSRSPARVRSPAHRTACQTVRMCWSRMS